MTHAEVKIVPRCMRAVPQAPLTTSELETAYTTLRRLLSQLYQAPAAQTALANAAGVLDDVLSMQEG